MGLKSALRTVSTCQHPEAGKKGAPMGRRLEDGLGPMHWISASLHVAGFMGARLRSPADLSGRGGFQASNLRAAPGSASMGVESMPAARVSHGPLVERRDGPVDVIRCVLLQSGRLHPFDPWEKAAEWLRKREENPRIDSLDNRGNQKPRRHLAKLMVPPTKFILFPTKFIL